MHLEYSGGAREVREYLFLIYINIYFKGCWNLITLCEVRSDIVIHCEYTADVTCKITLLLEPVTRRCHLGPFDKYRRNLDIWQTLSAREVLFLMVNIARLPPGTLHGILHAQHVIQALWRNNGPRTSRLM